MRDRNHPSIFMWSIGNEVLEQWTDAKADTLSLEEAKMCIRDSVSEIAYQLGFNNPKYFSKYFKDEFGVLPSVYQEREGK